MSRLTKNLVPRDRLVCPKCRGSRRTSSQGTRQSAPSVAAHEEPRPKGPVSLPQVSRLTKNLVPRDPSVCPKCRGSRRTSSQGTGQSAPRDPSVCPKCRGSRRTSSQGTGQSAPSVAAHEEPRPKGPVSLPRVSRLTKNLVPRDPSVCSKCRSSRRTSSLGTRQSAPSVAAHKEPRPKGLVSLPQVSRLTKNLVPRDRLVCPKCRGSRRTSSQGTGQSAPSVAAHEEPRPKGPVSLPQVSRLTKNLVPRDLSVCTKCRGSRRTSPQGTCQSAQSVAAHKEIIIFKT